MAYLDTCVLAAYYCPDPLSNAVDVELSDISAARQMAIMLDADVIL